MTEADTALIADALKAHDHEDWYHALLLHAIEETGDVADAIKVADMAYLEMPEGPSDA